MSDFTLKEKEVEDWKGKSKTYSDSKKFKNDLVNYIFETYGKVEKFSNNNIPKFGVSKGMVTNRNTNEQNPKRSKNTLDDLSEKYNI
jgi:hypothetical protein